MNSFTTSHCLAGVQPSPVKHSSVTCKSYLGRQNAITPDIPPAASFCSLYWWAWCHRVRNIPLVCWGQLSRLYPFPVSCAPAAYLLMWWCEKQKRSRCCLATTKTHLLSKLFKSQIQRIAPCKPLWGNVTLSQPKPVQTWIFLLSVSAVLKFFIPIPLVCVIPAWFQQQGCEGKNGVFQ